MRSANANAPVETNQIRTAAEEHMLAVVDNLVHTRMPVGARAPTQVVAALDKLDAQAGLSERAGSAHAGDAAAYHDCRFCSVGQHFPHNSGRCFWSILIIADETAERRRVVSRFETGSLRG